MILSPVLFRYISRNFLLNFLVLMSILLGIVYVLNLVEMMRQGSQVEHKIAFSIFLKLSALKLPDVGQLMIPFAILFSAIYTCWKLNKTSELIVIRASGLSAWQFLMPMVTVALSIGLLEISVVNPISSILLSRFEQVQRGVFDRQSDLVTVSRTGIWLRQPTDQGYALLHSDGFDQAEWRLTDVTVFFFDKKDKFTYRIDSPVSYLKDGYWELRDPLINERTASRRTDVEKLPTELTANKIEDSFASPLTISFWKIPDHIKIMEDAGFPATRLKLHFQSLLVEPLMLAAMILLAATFSLRPQRFGGTGIMIVLGVLAGFFIFFMESMLHAFGISQKISIYMAAWTPVAVSLLLGATALLHMEDG